MTNQANDQKARRNFAARQLLGICCVLSAMLLLLQALPTIRQALHQKPSVEIRHSEDAFLSPLTEKSENLLDPNQATIDELNALPGIGPIYAQAIVDYREHVSRLYFLEDLMNVKGIGEKRLEIIRPFLKEIGLPAVSPP